MAINHDELVKNEFWLRKIRKVNEVRDINKDGFLSKADFDIVIQRYKDMGSSDEHLQKLKKGMGILCMALGLDGENARVTHEEIIENFAKHKPSIDDIMVMFSTVFEILDRNGNGVISFKEWVDYYKVSDINTQYARASFDAMDTNGDGIVSKEEFYAFNREFYYSTEDKLNSSIMYGPLD